jgi:hypothetical protein
MLTIDNETFTPAVITHTALEATFKAPVQKTENEPLTFSIGIERAGDYFPLEIQLSVVEEMGTTKILLSSDQVLAPAKIKAGLGGHRPHTEIAPAVRRARHLVIEIPNETLLEPGTKEVRI